MSETKIKMQSAKYNLAEHEKNTLHAIYINNKKMNAKIRQYNKSNESERGNKSITSIREATVNGYQQYKNRNFITYNYNRTRHSQISFKPSST